MDQQRVSEESGATADYARRDAERRAARDDLKTAFVAGCVEMLQWLHSAMPQDDLDEAGYDYADSVLRHPRCDLCDLGFAPFKAEGIMWHQVNGRDPFRCTAI